ncbi:MAG: 2-oxo acid dehydrogenase subunit E2 [Anaerolineales bacterium]|nr:2-oxo acid dehydrogenase subunit E2 [Anaerolineales bacterium]
MPYEVIMPALEMAQDFGTLLEWRRSEGDQISKGEPLMEIETDKVTVEIEAPASGTLALVSALPGDVVPVGQVIALILAPGESIPEDLPRQQPPPEKTKSVSPPVEEDPGPPANPVEASPLAARVAAENNIDLSEIKPAGRRVEKADVLAFIEAQGQSPPDGRPSRLRPASPKARRLAAESGIDIGALRGSGPDGAVLAADVLAAESQPPGDDPATGPQTSLVAISNTWRVMAERITQSWTSVPHFYLIREVSAVRLQGWRSGALERFSGKLTYTDLLIYLVTAALREHPNINASWRDGKIELYSDINLGLAVAVEDGLVVPIIHKTNLLGLGEIVALRQQAVGKAKSGTLELEDIRGGTFTISNLGMFGVDAFNAIVNPPQAAILAVGRIADRVVAVDGRPAVRPMMTLSLSFDHRVVDGARGAQFLDTLADLIEEPTRLIE